MGIIILKILVSIMILINYIIFRTTKDFQKTVEYGIATIVFVLIALILNLT